VKAIRTTGAYWTYWLVFLLVPAALLIAIHLWLRLPEAVLGLVGVGLAALAFGPLSERVFRWWRASIWGISEVSSVQYPSDDSPPTPNSGADE
jgi:hypothetical protein